MLKKIYRFHTTLDQDSLHQIENKSFLIVHSLPPGDESIRVFGEKLCQAINLNKQEFGLLALKDSDFFDFGVLKKGLSEGHVLWMSKTPELYFPNFRIQKYIWFGNGTHRLLITDNAGELLQNKQMKAQLWTALKSEFL